MATVTGAGSKWIASLNESTTLNVGYHGAGILVIEGGGEVSASYNYLGRLSGSTGTAMVIGVGSRWTAGVLFVGHAGSGTLNIESGGEVEVRGPWGSIIGYTSGAPGMATVTGSGSKWTTSSFSIGQRDAGELTIEDGGMVSVGGTLTIDDSSRGDCFINMTTGGMLALHGDADDSLSQFLDLVQGNDAIRFWDDSFSGWAPLTAATLGVDYTLEYLAAGDLAGYTLLTVGNFVPEPSTAILLFGGLAMSVLGRRRQRSSEIRS